METHKFIPRMVVLELTRRCTLNCIHCRAQAGMNGYDSELSTKDWFEVLNDIASFSNPVIILSGGEALLREDAFDIIAHARARNLTTVLATCGITLAEEKAVKLKESGIKRVSVSIDGKDASTHDYIRQEKGSFTAALKAIELIKKYGIEFQINTTVIRKNFKELEEIFKIAVNLGAVSFHPFFMVPVGRGRNIQGEQLSAFEYEWALNKVREISLKSPIHCRPTCAPHYFRVLAQRKSLNADGRGLHADGRGFDAMTAGCLGGKSFAFISAEGKVQICGFLEVECGDIQKDRFSEIWRNSTVFNRLRNFDEYKGKCGECEYLKICGGCRARAYAATGDYLEEEPDCAYQPLTVRS